MLTQMLGLIREHAKKLSPRMGWLQHSADSAAANGSFGRSTEEAEEKLRRGEGAQLLALKLLLKLVLSLFVLKCVC